MIRPTAFSTPFPSLILRRGALGRGAAVAALLALFGCGTPSPRGYYPAAADQQLRAAAEAAASPATSSTATADTPATYLKLVEQMQRDGLWFASLAHIDAQEKRWGATPESMRLRADALRQTEQVEASRQLYGKLMGTPLEGAGYHGLGLIAGAQQEFPKAVQWLEQAQRRNPTDAMLLSDLGYAQMRAGQLPAARVPLMQALQLQPDSARIQVNVALYLEASGQSEQAQALMDSRQMPAATRAAIAAAARELPAGTGSVPSPAAQPVQVAVSGLAAGGIPNETLALKAAPWPRRLRVMVRPDPSAAGAAEPASRAGAIDGASMVPTSGAPR